MTDFSSVLKPLANLNNASNRQPFDVNQTSTSNGLPAGSPGGPVQLSSQQGIPFIYNQQNYSVQITLNNFNASQSVNITPASVIDLTIEETLASWVVSGSISLNYSYNTLEDTYNFRNDGYDTISIRIYPTTVVGGVVDVNTGSAIIDDFDQKEWELNYLFSIYNIEDIPSPPGARGAATATVKCKKFYFRDMRFHEMSTQVIQYSTALSSKVSTAGPDAADTARSLATGDIIKEIIEKSITEKTLNAVTNNTDDWDLGASKIFLTSPADTTAFDLMMYAYSKHVSSVGSGKNVNDFCVLSIERGPKFGDLGQFVLRPLSTYFKNAGSTADAPGLYQIEHFYIQDNNDGSLTGNSKNSVGLHRAPRKQAKKSSDPDLTLPDYSHIRTYEYVEISPFTNANNFVTRPVYSYDLSQRVFNVEFQGNDVVSARSFMGTNYVKQVLNQGDNTKNVQITLASNKKDLNIQPVFSLYGQDRTIRESDGILKLLKIGVFQNSCIVFTVPGLTTRRVGRFIGIDRALGSPLSNSTFDDKFCGQWFIIDVKHIFRGSEYHNVITAVKLHRYQTQNTFQNTL